MVDQDCSAIGYLWRKFACVGKSKAILSLGKDSGMSNLRDVKVHFRSIKVVEFLFRFLFGAKAHKAGVHSNLRPRSTPTFTNHRNVLPLYGVTNLDYNCFGVCCFI